METHDKLLHGKDDYGVDLRDIAAYLGLSYEGPTPEEEGNLPEQLRTPFPIVERFKTKESFPPSRPAGTRTRGFEPVPEAYPAHREIQEGQRTQRKRGSRKEENMKVLSIEGNEYVNKGLWTTHLVLGIPKTGEEAVKLLPENVSYVEDMVIVTEFTLYGKILRKRAESEEDLRSFFDGKS